MCDCIKNLNERLKAEYGDASSFMDDNGHGRVSMSAMFRPKTADGSYYKHARYLSIRPAFCPFCGKPYEEGKKETKIYNPY